jgi:hypothetical protein
LRSLQIDAAAHPPVIDVFCAWRSDFTAQNTTGGLVECKPSSAVSSPWGVLHHVCLAASTNRDVGRPSVRGATIGSQMSDPCACIAPRRIEYPTRVSTGCPHEWIAATRCTPRKHVVDRCAFFGTAGQADLRSTHACESELCVDAQHGQAFVPMYVCEFGSLSHDGRGKPLCQG